MRVRTAERLANVAGVSEWRLERVELVRRVAACVLTAVLLLTTACVLGAAAALPSATASIRDVRIVANELRSANYALATEQSLGRLYRLEPTAETFIANREAAASLETSMHAVRRLSDNVGRDVVDLVLLTHRHYLDESRRLFIEVNRNQHSVVIASQRDRVDPTFETIAALLNREAHRQDAIARRQVADLLRLQYLIADVAALFSLVGLGCLGCFLAILRTYRSRLLASYGVEIRKLDEAAHVDALTGIGNQRAFKRRLEAEIACANNTHEPLTLALLDVDEFKVINDRDGHVQGDRVLATLGHLMTSLRGSDHAYRVGGDEFAIVFPATSIADARHVVERLQTNVSVELFGTTLSIGLAGINGSSSTQTLISDADAALYGAKRAGRNRVVAFDEPSASFSAAFGDRSNASVVPRRQALR